MQKYVDANYLKSRFTLEKERYNVVVGFFLKYTENMSFFYYIHRDFLFVCFGLIWLGLVLVLVLVLVWFGLVWFGFLFFENVSKLFVDIALRF